MGCRFAILSNVFCKSSRSVGFPNFSREAEAKGQKSYKSRDDALKNCRPTGCLHRKRLTMDHFAGDRYFGLKKAAQSASHLTVGSSIEVTACAPVSIVSGLRCSASTAFFRVETFQIGPLGTAHTRPKTVGYRLARIYRKRPTLDLWAAAGGTLRPDGQGRSTRSQSATIRSQLGVAVSIVSRLRYVEMAAVRVSENVSGGTSLPFPGAVRSERVDRARCDPLSIVSRLHASTLGQCAWVRNFPRWNLPPASRLLFRRIEFVRAKCGPVSIVSHLRCSASAAFFSVTGPFT